MHFIVGGKSLTIYQLGSYAILLGLSGNSNTPDMRKVALWYGESSSFCENNALGFQSLDST